MKNKLKAFYEKHESRIHLISIATVALAGGTAVYTLKVYGDTAVVDADRSYNDEGWMRISVVQKHGKVTNFYWEPKEA